MNFLTFMIPASLLTTRVLLEFSGWRDKPKKIEVTLQFAPIKKKLRLLKLKGMRFYNKYCAIFFFNYQ